MKKSKPGSNPFDTLLNTKNTIDKLYEIESTEAPIPETILQEIDQQLKLMANNKATGK